MKQVMEKLEHLLEIGGIRKDIILLVISGAACLGFSRFPLTWHGLLLFYAVFPSF